MLSKKAQELINQYFNLPFNNVPNVRCPYFNNKRRLQKGQLSVLIGKGLPQEIVGEAKITSIQYDDDIFDYKGNCQTCGENKATDIRQYLIDHDLGIDCSGFVVNILREHIKETKNFDFTKDLYITPKRKILRYLISKLRPVENTSVKILADKKNSDQIKNISDIKIGDLIIMLQSGPDNKRDHILLITDIQDNVIKYVHARSWSSEGKYGHGVAQGIISISDKKEGLLKQTWQELKKINQENETYLEAKNAKTLEIRRIKY